MSPGRLPPGVRRELLPALCMLPIVLAAIALAATVTFRGGTSVDNRHYVEMATGFRAHGLPYTLNAYSEDFTAARPAFNLPHDGKLWGIYPPLYPLLASLALRLGGLAAVGKQNFLILALLGVAVYALGRKLTGDPRRGVLAAYLVLLASPVWGSSTETLAQPLQLFLIVLVPLCGLYSLEAARTSRRGRSAVWAGLAGLAGGLGLATHLIAGPMSLAALCALAAIDPDEATPARIRLRDGAVRLGASLFCWVLPLVPVARLNHLRFGSYNPLSYGPCIWSHCALFESNDLHAGALLGFFLPSLVYFAAVAGALYASRRCRWPVRIGVGVAAALGLALPTPLRAPAWAMLRTLYGYFVDLAVIDWGHPYGFATFDDGLGHHRGGQVLKSLLQSSPIFACAALAGYGLSGRKGRSTLVLAPVVGLAAALALLARFEPPYNFGDPHVILRYVIPAAPLLAPLAADVLFRIRPRAWHVVGAAACGLGALLWLCNRDDDAQWLERIFVLRVTLLLGVLAVVLLAWRTRGAALACCACIAVSVAVTLGVDTRALGALQASLEREVQAFERQTPKRLALVGYGPQTNHVLTLRAQRDINYIDLLESKGWDDFRVLIDLWADDDRPVYGIFPTGIDPPFQWPYADWDVPATRLDERLNLWKIGPPAPGRRLTREQTSSLRGQLNDAWLARGRRPP